MEILIGVAVLVAAGVALAAGTVIGAGETAWTMQRQRLVGKMWLAVVVIGLSIVSVWFGLAVVVSLWPLWLVFGVVSAVWYGLGEWRARRHERQTLAARLAELERRGPLPAWAAGIRERETTKNGGAFSWLDRL